MQLPLLTLDVSGLAKPVAASAARLWACKATIQNNPSDLADGSDRAFLTLTSVVQLGIAQMDADVPLGAGPDFLPPTSRLHVAVKYHNP